MSSSARQLWNASVPATTNETFRFGVASSDYLLILVRGAGGSAGTDFTISGYMWDPLEVASPTVSEATVPVIATANGFTTESWVRTSYDVRGMDEVTIVVRNTTAGPIVAKINAYYQS